MHAAWGLEKRIIIYEIHKFMAHKNSSSLTLSYRACHSWDTYTAYSSTVLQASSLNNSHARRSPLEIQTCPQKNETQTSCIGSTAAHVQHIVVHVTRRAWCPIITSQPPVWPTTWSDVYAKLYRTPIVSKPTAYCTSASDYYSCTQLPRSTHTQLGAAHLPRLHARDNHSSRALYIHSSTATFWRSIARKKSTSNLRVSEHHRTRRTRSKPQTGFAR